MILDDGAVWICTLANVAGKGEMPKEKLIRKSEHLYGERTVGYGRQYAAKGVSEQVDMLIRIWQDRCWVLTSKHYQTYVELTKQKRNSKVNYATQKSTAAGRNVGRTTHYQGGIIMKKIIAILLALLLIMSLAIPAAAVTPTLQIPKVPQISNIKIEVKLPEQVYENAVQKWFAEHPIQLPKFKIPAWGD